MFVCLFVWIKPELLYFAPCVWREVITPGNCCTRTQTQTTCVTLRQRHRPRMYQLMANTLQVDGLARITGLTQAPYKTQRSLSLVCLFVCLFVWVKPENLYFTPCVWREVITPGNGCRRNQAQKLSFTQDGLAFSTKTARRTLQDHVRDTKNTVVQI